MPSGYIGNPSAIGRDRRCTAAVELDGRVEVAALNDVDAWIIPSASAVSDDGPSVVGGRDMEKPRFRIGEKRRESIS